MGFISLLLLWPLALATWVLSLLDIALPVILTILLIWNLFVLIVLLVVRHIWKASGTMDRAYIDALGGWKRVVLLILRYGLLVFIIWEVILILAVIYIWAVPLTCGAKHFWFL